MIKNLLAVVWGIFRSKLAINRSEDDLFCCLLSLFKPMCPKL